jgi:hypothetical protein
MLRLLALMLFAAPACAGPFAELGIGSTVDSCLYKDTEFYASGTGLGYRADCTNAPLGFVSVGYRVPKTGLVLQLDHVSGITDTDPGLNTVSIRYRWEARD